MGETSTINSMMALGQQLIQEATQLKLAGANKTSAGARKGLDHQQKLQLIEKRNRTAFKKKAA